MISCAFLPKPNSGKILGLTSDSTVVGAAPLSFEGKENAYGRLNVSEWTDIVAVSGDDFYSVGLKADGTFVLAGQIIDYNNQKNTIRELLQWENIRVHTGPLPARNGHETWAEASVPTGQ